MAAVISVKGTGSERTAALDAIALDAPSVVTLKIPPSAVESFTRDGNHLLLKLHDGRVVRIENFYIESDGAKSDLVLEDPSGDLWFGDHTAGLADFQFSEIASVDHLIGGGREWILTDGFGRPGPSRRRGSRTFRWRIQR
ncbi:BapA/Bap/LapF family prefix-like domain-containing protein [Nitratireductor sp. L15S-10]|uniref:BapA/Bap/LapF family prefix-like domain-containing protein n=1 Tax=Nitratireductor sp. L15S-10 TaxID=3034028 RepID=UPI003857B0F4